MILHAKVDYKQYFSGMELTLLEQLKREAEAQQFEYWVLLFFWLLENDVTESDSIEDIDRPYYYDMVYQRYHDWVEEWLLLVAASDRVFDSIPKELEKQIRQKAIDIVDATLDHSDDEYYTSEERASVIAANETNFIGNYRQIEEAKQKGYTLKKWVTKRDMRVRHTHVAVDNKVLGIDEYFQVGAAKMLYPLDQSTGNHPEECVNCRCVLEFM